MPVRRADKAAWRSQLTASGTQQAPYPSPQARARAPAAASHSAHRPAAPAAIHAYQPEDPLRPSQIFATQDAEAENADQGFTQGVPGDPDYDLVLDARWGGADQSQDTGSLQEPGPQPTELGLLDLDEWDENETYDQNPPTCLHYSIEWKVTLNNKPVSKDTEQDLVLAPRFYWSLFLRPKLEKLLKRKLLPHKRVTCDDTSVTVSVTGRSERDLTKRFDETDVDWSIVEKQLLAWAELFRAGKKLRLDLSFNYVEDGQPAAAVKRTGKRGPSSVTQRMLTERASQLDAEEHTSGQQSIWRDVYEGARF